MTIILKGGLLIDGRGGKPLPDSVIVIREGKIAGVYSREEGASWGEVEAQVLDVRGKTVLPGLIDSHAHLIMRDRLPPGKQSRQESDQELLLKAVANAQEALTAGVTMVRDCGSRGTTVLALREAINAGMVKGPRLWVSGPAISTTAGHGSTISIAWEADSSLELSKAVRSLVKWGVDFIKVMATGGRGTPGSNTRAPQYTAEELRAVVEDAHRLGKLVAAHALPTEGIRNAVEAGVDIIAHCAWLGREEGTIDYDEAVVRKMAAKKLCVDLNISAGLNLLAENDGRHTRFAPPVPRTRWDLVRRMKDAGVRVILSTDATGGALRVKDFPSLLGRLIVEGGASPLEVIAMATGEPAEVFGLGDEIGTVEVGKVADLLVVDGDPLEDAAALARPSLVLKDGKVAAIEGKLLAI